MLKVRVIPTLLWKRFGLVKGVSFDSWRTVGPALPAIKIYNQRDVDELFFVDIAANNDASDPDFELISELSQDCFIPLTVGGGIKTLDHAEKLLRNGADKLAVNSACYEYPELVSIIAKRFGSQCFVASIDVKYDGKQWYCFSNSGNTFTNREIVAWAREMEDRGAGELLITSIDRDGTMIGYDLKLIETVAKTVRIPVIASGGAGNYQHMIDAIKLAGASAVAAASIFHFTEQTPAKAKAALASAGISVREPFMELIKK